MTALSGMRNDLEEAAREIVPEIAEVKALLGESGALLARMSGSGATCFGTIPGGRGRPGRRGQDATAPGPAGTSADGRTLRIGVTGQPT